MNWMRTGAITLAAVLAACAAALFVDAAAILTPEFWLIVAFLVAALLLADLPAHAKLSRAARLLLIAIAASIPVAILVRVVLAFARW